jgi:hypothetical protein
MSDKNLSLQRASRHNTNGGPQKSSKLLITIPLTYYNYDQHFQILKFVKEHGAILERDPGRNGFLGVMRSITLPEEDAIMFKLMFDL